MTLDPIAYGIKHIINEKGLLQKTVAMQSGFSTRQFSDMVNDRKIIRAIDLIPISAALGVTPQEIFEAGKLLTVSAERPGA